MYETFLDSLKKSISSLKQKTTNHINLLELLEEKDKLPISEWSVDDLQLVHVVLHTRFRDKRADKKTIVKFHQSLVSEMKKRGLAHLPFDKLDKIV
jgi:hypothetical protein